MAAVGPLACLNLFAIKKKEIVLIKTLIKHE